MPLVRIPLAAMLLCCISVSAQTSPAPTPLADAFLQGRSSLILNGSSLSGDGLSAFTADISNARFVLIGETHLTHEIPLFTTAICGLMHPDAYAVEVGPIATEFINAHLRSPDRIAAMQA